MMAWAAKYNDFTTLYTEEDITQSNSGQMRDMECGTRSNILPHLVLQFKCSIFLKTFQLTL